MVLRTRMQNKIQLITYIDRLGCKNIDELNSLIQNEFEGLFGAIHLLPFYNPIDGADAGFDPIDHTQIDSRLGDWKNLKELTKNIDIMSDLIVNHISAESNQFKDYLKKGHTSEFTDLVLTKEKVFHDCATEEDISKIYRPRPGLPFTKFRLGDGDEKLIWTTFTPNQIDIDVNSKMGQAYLENILDTFQRAGISIIRLDAAGYAIKKQGTSCFMIEETYQFIEQLSKKAKSRGIEVLVEIHSYYKTQIEIAKRVDYVYDFALPPLVLDCLFNQDATSLKNWLKIAPRNVITVLDTHDGIGIIDVASEDGNPGLVDEAVLDKIVERIHINSGGKSLQATGTAASNLDLYQVNCTYFEALGKDENAYLIARAIQFFVPGVPQIYYVGLLGGENDMNLLAKTKVGRDINRHYFTSEEINETLKTTLFSNLKKLILFRNSHEAFKGDFKLKNTEKHILIMEWTHGENWAELTVDLRKMKFSISYSAIDHTNMLLLL